MMDLKIDSLLELVFAASGAARKHRYVFERDAAADIC